MKPEQRRAPAADTADAQKEGLPTPLQRPSLAQAEGALKPCGEPYQAIDLLVRICGRPAGHEPADAHFPRPLPFDRHPEPEIRIVACVECGLDDDYRALTLCDQCGQPVHPACCRQCDRCGALTCGERVDCVHSCIPYLIQTEAGL